MMQNIEKYVIPFEEVSLQDIASVGGKNGSLGEMIQHLASQHIPVPSGFIITVKAYWHFIDSNNLRSIITEKLATLDDTNIDALQKIGLEIRTLMMEKKVPDDLAHAIKTAYEENEKRYGKQWSAAMRSSATAEDLPSASFAGQQETLLNIQSSEQIIKNVPRIFASLFTDRAISYRMHHNFEHMKVALSIGVQKMIRSDLASSGVIFTLDTETGFRDVVYITASYGLGENIVQGIVNPDEFYVHKPTRRAGHKSLLKKRLGSKEQKLIFSSHNDQKKTVENIPVDPKDQAHYSITDQEILQLADYAIIIENYYSQCYKKPTPMDIEWAKDGETNQLFIVQARPETVHANQKTTDTFIKTTKQFITHPDQSKLIITGNSVGDTIISGPARHIRSTEEINRVQTGDIIVANITDPDWEPLMKKAAGIITNQGGRTCHAAIVSRELNIPAVIGTINGTEKITDGQKITLDCSQGSMGYIYQGTYETKTITHEIKVGKKLPLWINVGNPDEAFSSAALPYQGIGLARLEFIINASIKIHPMALLFPQKTDAPTQALIQTMTCNYATPEEFFIKTLAQEISTIAAAAYPRPINVRFSDFKSNEYRNLIGGSFFEPTEENPMLGFRGASRYYDEHYKAAFELECKAFLYARHEIGFTNIHGLVPFVRTLKEAELVSSLIEASGLKRNQDGFQLLMMCEIPANALLLEKFAQYFDGFSIGSNDLTQLTLGVDRDSGLIAPIFDEQNEAIQILLKMSIEKANKLNKKISICGQAPETFPELAQQLLDWGIDAISCTTRGFFNLYEQLK